MEVGSRQGDPISPTSIIYLKCVITHYKMKIVESPSMAGKLTNCNSQMTWIWSRRIYRNRRKMWMVAGLHINIEKTKTIPELVKERNLTRILCLQMNSRYSSRSK